MASAAMDVDAVRDEPAAKHQKITHVVSRDDDDEAPPFMAPPTNAVEPAPLKVRVRLPATASLTRGRSAEAAATMASLLPPPPPPPPQTRGQSAEAAAALALLTASSDATTAEAERKQRVAAADRPQVAPFVRTLYRLMEGPYAETFCDWSDAGRRIVFSNPKTFGEVVCPQYDPASMVPSRRWRTAPPTS